MESTGWSGKNRCTQYPSYFLFLLLHPSPPTIHLSLHLFLQWRPRRFSALENGIHPPQAQSKTEELELEPEQEMEPEPELELELESEPEKP